MSSGPTIAALLGELAIAFPAANPLVLRPPTAAFDTRAARYSGGHAARWFAAADGQEGEEPFADGHALCSLSEALEAAKIADALRSEPDGYWVEPSWVAIASDGAGQHLMIDDRDGRVLAVAHDDDHVRELADSPEAWLSGLVEGHGRGAIVWDEVFGLVDREKLEQVHSHRRAQAARASERAQIPMKHRVGLAVTVALAAALSLLVAWLLETHR